MRRLSPFWIAAAVAAAGCGGNTGVAPECQTDTQCAGQDLCVGGSCLAPAQPPETWSVEIDPLSDETMAAFTERTVPSGELSLTADGKVTITGSFVQVVPELAPPESGHVVLSIAPGVPGRPDLQVETEVMTSSIDGVKVPNFTAAVPAGVIGRATTVTVTPPDGDVRAPLRFKTALGSTSLSLALPSAQLMVTGNIYSAIGIARPSYLARVFLNATGRLVSDVSRTDMGGGFELHVPVTDEIKAAGQTMTVELRPADSAVAEPRFLQRFTLVADPTRTLGNLYQPAFANANVFRLNLRGESADGPAVEDAVVRARTVLLDDASAGSTADFLRDGRTDADGNTDLSLLPGTANASRSYVITVVPPSGSAYGVLCIPAFPVATGGTAVAPAHLQVLALPLRPVLSGTVLDANGAPVDGVSVTATPTAADPGNSCADGASSPPAAAVTKDGGRFALTVDPGTYRIDYDPPRGSPVPRLTENDLVVGASIDRNVQLPRGGVVKGRAKRPDGSPLPSAGIRLYEVRCSGADQCLGPARVEPTLRATARTDAMGYFRAVIALPATVGP